MDITIRLIKEWENGGTKYPEGQLLKVSEENAQSLIKNGIAEIYVAKADDVVVPNNANGTGMTEDDVTNVAKTVIAEFAKAEAEKLPAGPEGEVIKTGGFANFAHFAKEVVLGSKDLSNSPMLEKYINLVKASGMNEAISSEGGVLIPTEFKAQLLMNALEESLIRAQGTVIPMATNSVKIPIVLETSRASSVYGGVIIYRPDEAASKTSSKPKLSSIELNLKKLIGLVYVTDELLEDSPISLQPLLSTMFSSAIAFQEDDDFINGTGAGQALGVLNAPCCISVTKETGQAGTSIVANNLFKMKSRLNPRSWGRARWFAHQDTYPQLRILSVPVGTGGTVIPLFTESGGKMMLDGLPINFTEHCQTLGTSGDILLGDWSQYLIGQKVGSALKIDTSIHVKFVDDETAFRFVMRYDGQPWWPSALTPKHGASTVSPFVKLNARG